MSTLKQFVVWLDCPIEEASNKKVLGFIDYLLDKKLKPKTINCYLDSIRSFYDYLREGEDLEIANPVKSGYCLRLSKPLPRFLKDEEVSRFLEKLEGPRDRAMFLLMLRCGLRVEEVASLTLGALDLRRGSLLVKSGKGAKDRMVYVSPDAHEALTCYLKERSRLKSKSVFLVERGRVQRKANIGKRNPKENGILRRDQRPQSFLSSPEAYHGHSAPQCRCGHYDYPGSPWP